MRPRDRLPELLRRAGEPARGACVDLSRPPHPPHIAQLLQLTESVCVWVREVRAGTMRVRSLLAHPAAHTDSQVQQQVEGAVTLSNAAALKVTGALRQLEEAGGAPGAAGKIARLQAACGRRALSSALDEQHALLAAARDQHLQLLRHHAHIVNAAITDEECERLLQADSIALFVDNVRAETAAARRALREAEARHGELKRVEAALEEVRALFLQLSALVCAQQDQLDTVAHFALQASEHVGSGQHQLLKGSVGRRKANKKKYGLIICLASGFILVLLVLVIT